MFRQMPRSSRQLQSFFHAEEREEEKARRTVHQQSTAWTGCGWQATSRLTHLASGMPQRTAAFVQLLATGGSSNAGLPGAWLFGTRLAGGGPTCGAGRPRPVSGVMPLALFGSRNKDLPEPLGCKLPAPGGWGSCLKVLPFRGSNGKKNVFVFPGGYEAFSASCPELCSKQSTPMGLSLPLSTSVPDSTESGCSSCSTPLYDQGGPVEILPFLYLGSAYHASRKDMLDALGITALINVSANCPNHFEGHYQYKSIPVEDNHKADISSWFNEAIDFIDSIKNAGGRVFVHCQAGISRSATICLAYLMRTNRVKLDEAFEFVKQRRSIISPNFSFMGQLLQFESQVLAPHCSAEAGSPAMAVLDRGTSTTTVFNFPVSIPVHSTNSALSYLQSPITTSPSC
ncbi:dual specificity protein phosphatase 1 [Marmota marmota marmota]|uniref:dual specificity protein phosphatase 1 n=1 Tax=Marmota marmota marmota TaxID=9994 RepID=UPI002093D6F6|nr:dual specificity protein phosphatase 1 [Marmota marmota marmota]